MTNFLDHNPEFRANVSSNEDLTNWTWPEEIKKADWTLAHKRWQDFAKQWRSAEDTFASESRQLDFGHGTGLPAPDRLFVRDVYLEAEKVVWGTAKARPKTGVILTGQPGIGKTLFIWYLLVRLLQMKQVILFNVAGVCRLFYHDKAYKPKGTPDLDCLPFPTDSMSSGTMPASTLSGAMYGSTTSGAIPTSSGSMPHPFIWSLLDIDKGQPIPRVALAPWCFPVQSPSPDQIRYREWRKERSPTFTGFPLWSREELAFGARLDPRYQTLSEALLTEKLKEVSATYPNENYPEDASEGKGDFDIFLDHLIWYFGEIPRDIFTAMYDFNTVVQSHQSALAVDYQVLKMVVDKVCDNEQFPDSSSPSHRLISITIVNNKWTLDFKSQHIGQQFLKKMVQESWKELRQLIQHFLQMPQTRGLAGKLFEPFVHRYIEAGAPDDNDQWQVRTLYCSDYDGDAPTFSVCRNITQTIACFKNSMREWTFFDPDKLFELKNDRYYVPFNLTNPLFNSFVVEFNKRSAKLWILQITTSPQHKGSANGYVVIRKIIRKVIGQLKSKDSHKPPPAKKRKEEEPKVNVYYVLVRPTEDKELCTHWAFPKGWSEFTKEIDHRGQGYLLDIPMGSKYLQSRGLVSD